MPHWIGFEVALYYEAAEKYTPPIENISHIKEKYAKAIQKKDYGDFNDTPMIAEGSHKTLAAIMGAGALLKHTEGWNPFEWNWNMLKRFHNAREKTKRRPHPYQIGERRRRIRNNETENREAEWSYESHCNRTDIMSNDTVHVMRLDEELLKPMFFTIVANVSETKNDITNQSELTSLHHKVLHQTQIVVKELSTMIEHVQKQSMPTSQTTLESMVIDSTKCNNEQTRIINGC